MLSPDDVYVTNPKEPKPMAYSNRYTIVGYEPQEDLPAVAVEKWYNRTERAWVVRFIDAEGVQVGPSEYIYSGKQDAIDMETKMVGMLTNA